MRRINRNPALIALLAVAALGGTVFLILSNESTAAFWLGLLCAGLLLRFARETVGRTTDRQEPLIAQVRFEVGFFALFGLAMALFGALAATGLVNTNGSGMVIGLVCFFGAFAAWKAGWNGRSMLKTLGDDSHRSTE